MNEIFLSNDIFSGKFCTIFLADYVLIRSVPLYEIPELLTRLVIGFRVVQFKGNPVRSFQLLARLLPGLLSSESYYH